MTTFYRKNFSQAAPRFDDSTSTYVGIPLTNDELEGDPPHEFIQCNLVNTEPPADSTITNCNTAIVRREVVDEDESIEIAVGGRILVVDKPKDLLLGRLKPNHVYEYRTEPLETTDGARERI